MSWAGKHRAGEVGKSGNKGKESEQLRGNRRVGIISFNWSQRQENRLAGRGGLSSGDYDPRTRYGDRGQQ